MPVSVYFKNLPKAGQGGSISYLFFQAEKIQFLYDTQIDPINLMGNGAGAIYGGNSNNLVIKLGTLVGTIRIEGTLTSMKPGDHPDSFEEVGAVGNNLITVASGSWKHYTYTGDAVTHNTLSSVTHYKNNFSAVHLRAALLRLTANQGSDDVLLGWPRWLDIRDEEGLEPSDIGTAQLFTGAIRSLRIQEAAGETKQYPFVIEFVIGKSKLAEQNST